MSDKLYRADFIKQNSKDYTDLLKIVASNYEMYERGYNLISPWISRQVDSIVPIMPPSAVEISASLGKPRACIHPKNAAAYSEALSKFALEAKKTRRQLIHPNPSTHHSAQFAKGTFSIERLGTGYKLQIFGCSDNIIVKDVKIKLEGCQFIIIKPKLGKLGTASINRWEVLFFQDNHGYLINHTDSDLNPRFAGII